MIGKMILSLAGIIGVVFAYSYLNSDGEFSIEDLMDETINRFRTNSVEAEMELIISKIKNNYRSGMPIPNEFNFDSWLSENIINDDHDSWIDQYGNPYRLKIIGDNLTVISNGQDGEADTDDDVELSVKLKGSAL